ncbi:hypothetical protein KC19_2G274700 [Ceratodon purpureus]|uniref:Secreted protein n=1 Tax=Ceratodon purpureus TaxID=3225 RepID=A0A8T0J1V9_CERPU|nr:hypothetical protein KC19_2G274700 [Ceratodon purpureus]
MQTMQKISCTKVGAPLGLHLLLGHHCTQAEPFAVSPVTNVNNFLRRSTILACHPPSRNNHSATIRVT